MSRPLPHFLALASTLALATPALAAAYTATDRQPTPEELASLPGVVPEKVEALRKDVRVPSEFDFTIFATPPAVNYPVFVAAAPDGTLYVSSDGNGSLDRKPHLGRVLRVRDTNGDGQADEVKAFVPDVDSPRGLVWDHDRLYLLHPPDVSVFIDRNGDGEMDEKQTLVKGIAFTFKDRPADHSSNGLELGIDGWLYAAIGDFGFLEATGADGRTLQMRGGGVVRFRPDGTGLERYAFGTRNILEVAISPLLDGFARDNTNDGGGWDIRLHHFGGGDSQHGYPTLFKNFADEILQPLADYGGGSGCGGGWIDEPGIPARWNNAPLTADWGRDWIYHHGVTAKGATFSATQEEFIHLPRVTDLDVDANGAIYAASWKGASFTWVGPEVGFLVRATPKGYQPAPLPDFEKATPKELASLLTSPSQGRRLAAQRALIRRDAGQAVQRDPTLLLDLVADASLTLPTRVAAIFAMKQAMGADANALLQRYSADPAIQAWILRALGDRPDQAAQIDPKRLTAGLKSQDARTRKEAAIALARLGSRDNAGAITAVLGDSDPVVSQAAVQALIQLQAVDACLPIVDYGKPESAVRSAALRVLQGLPQSRVVEALIERLGTEIRPEQRKGLLTALCRLHFVEGPWKGDSWGTRPDTRGPWYQPEPWSETTRIGNVLRTTLERTAPEEAAHIAREMARHRIPAGDALDKLIARAAQDASLAPALAAQLAQAETTPAAAIPVLARVATEAGTPDAARAQSVIALARTDSPEAWRAILQAYARVQATQSENNLAEKARGAVLNAPNLDQAHGVFEEEAARLAGETSQVADILLLKLAARKVGAPEAREAASKALDAGWANPKRRLQILQAATRAGDASRAAQIVAALTDSDPEIAKAAKEATKRLRIDPEKFRAAAAEPKVGDRPVPEVLEAMLRTKGEVSRGEQLFTQLSCSGCHTVKEEEPPKGPFLGTIANTYRRRDLAEAILLPNKTLAQGFATHHFELKDGTEIDGFVVQEAADAVTVRNAAAQEFKIPVGQIAKRERQERSIMPEGLAAGITLADLASILDYLESLPPKKTQP
jgi:putative membrane-bound dehydrogenase-like protein